MAKQVKKGTTIFSFRNQLHHRFVNTAQIPTEHQIIRGLYKEYKKQLSQPKLTTNNLIRVNRYIKKHKLHEAHYDEAIKKASSHKPILRVRDFRHIYKEILKRVHLKTRMDKNKVDMVYDWMLQKIIDVVDNGGSACLRQFGTFSGKRVKARRYRIPSKPNKFIKIGSHIRIHFSPSQKWSKSLRPSK